MTKNDWLSLSLFALVSGVAAIADAQFVAPLAGMLSPLEHQDKNGDGAITLEELEACALERWGEDDLNHDGKVTSDELRASLVKRRQQLLVERDRNGDGVIEKTEIVQMPEALFVRLDVDQSGTLSQTELQTVLSGPERMTSFADASRQLPGDSDHDGAISKPEVIASTQALMKRLDLNADGSLSGEETDLRAQFQRGIAPQR